MGRWYDLLMRMMLLASALIILGIGVAIMAITLLANGGAIWTIIGFSIGLPVAVSSLVFFRDAIWMQASQSDRHA